MSELRDEENQEEQMYSESGNTGTIPEGTSQQEDDEFEVAPGERGKNNFTEDGKREIHEYAEFFPLMGGEEFEHLKEDIKRNGQIEPILLYQGKIVDGRNRYRACIELGKIPLLKDWTDEDIDDGKLIDKVLSLNLHRRHLSASQRALGAAKIMKHFEPGAKKRQGARTDIDPDLIRSCDFGRSVEKAAKKWRVSPSLVNYAARVLKSGIDEIIIKVESDNLAVSRAAKIAGKPRDKQMEILEELGTKQSRRKKPSVEGSSVEPTPPMADDRRDLHELLDRIPAKALDAVRLFLNEKAQMIESVPSPVDDQAGDPDEEQGKVEPISAIQEETTDLHGAESPIQDSCVAPEPKNHKQLEIPGFTS